MFLWIGSDGNTAELEPQTQAEEQLQARELLFDHMQLKDDQRKERDFNNWVDEAAEIESDLIATYIKQYDIPEWLADILKDHDYSEEQFQYMFAELKRETIVKDTAVTA